MDIPIKKKPFLLKYKFQLAAGTAALGILIYLIVISLGPQRLRYDADKLEIVEVKRDKFLEYIDVEGVVQPKLTIKLNSFESGSVERIVAEDGSLLHAGDTVLVLRNPELERAIDDERDALAKQQVSFREKHIQMERTSSELKRKSLEAAYTLEKTAKENVLNEQEYSIGVRSKAQYELGINEFEFQKANNRIMMEQIRHDSLLNAIQIELMNNDLAREEKRFQRSCERLDMLVVRAPIDGQLSFVSVIVGERVSAGANIGELKVVDQVKISTRVSEYYIDRITTGLPATVVWQNERYPLRITRINPEIRDRQFAVDLVFADRIIDNIRIGKNYRVQIELEQPEEALVIPKGTFFSATGGQWIFVVDKDGSRAHRRTISIGRQNPQSYEVLNGLTAGERVIVTGYEKLGEAKEVVISE